MIPISNIQTKSGRSFIKIFLIQIKVQPCLLIGVVRGMPECLKRDKEEQDEKTYTRKDLILT